MDCQSKVTAHFLFIGTKRRPAYPHTLNKMLRCAPHLVQRIRDKPRVEHGSPLRSAPRSTRGTRKSKKIDASRHFPRLAYTPDPLSVSKKYIQVRILLQKKNFLLIDPIKL
jgi:hypothetical protein